MYHVSILPGTGAPGDLLLTASAMLLISVSILPGTGAPGDPVQALFEEDALMFQSCRGPEPPATQHPQLRKQL